MTALVAVEDRRRGAVVARQGDDVGAGEALAEVEDVAHRGGAEAVDGLGVVADAGDAAAVGPQQRDDVGLQRVGVLELVDEHVVEALAHARPGDGVGEQAAPEEEQVVVVQDLLLLLAVRVAREELCEPRLRRLAPRERRAQHLRQRQLRVDAARVHVEARGLLREARAVAADAERGARDVHEVLGVAAVEDREVRLQADVARVHAQQARGDGVERAAPDALLQAAGAEGGEAGGADGAGGAGSAAGRGRLRQQRVDAPQHLGGGAAREREQQDAPRVGAAGDEVRDAVHQRGRLAGARAGDDEQRAVAVRGGGELLGIEVGEHGRTPVRYRRAHRSTSRRTDANRRSSSRERVGGLARPLRLSAAPLAPARRLRDPLRRSHVRAPAPSGCRSASRRSLHRRRGGTPR